MSALLRRALLYVPGSSIRMLEKSQKLNVDCVTYDLEDSVIPSFKGAARENIKQLLQRPRASGIREQAVRINAIKTGLAEDDLNSVLQSTHVDAIVIPKVETASDITFVDDALTYHSHSSTKIMALIESARALLNIREICTASPTRLSGLIFAAEDFAFDVGLERTPSLLEMIYARQTIVTAAVAHKLCAIDLVCTEHQDTIEEGPLARECKDGVRMGFTGKQVIHPSQVDLVQRLFSPSKERVAWALRVLIANEKAVEDGRGAWTLDGKMIDAPVIGAAEKLVRKAELAGVDIGALREKYKDTTPE
ncbi:citrate lyase subunit beta-like protein [Kalaharituber pfeilii]|nr:citrate lyase subunit beta-like protein [Kalaharituber pfeilii]